MSSKIWIVIVTIISFVLSYNAYDYYYQFSDRVFLSSLIIQFISIVSIFSRKDEPFSLFKMFSLEEIGDQWLELFNSLLNENGENN